MTKKEIIFGRKPILEALQDGIDFDKILYNAKSIGPEMDAIIRTAKSQSVSVISVPRVKIERLLWPLYGRQNVNHQGVLGIKSPVQFFKAQDLLDKCYDEGRVPLFLVLDGVTDTRNFGAIVRSAECFGVDGLIVPHRGSAAIDAFAVKSSAGAIHNLPICKMDWEETKKFLQGNGIALAGASIDTETFIQDIDMTIPLAIVMGSEGSGLSDNVRKHCQHLFQIPMVGQTESLNVSVSAGISLYEVLRQRLIQME